MRESFEQRETEMDDPEFRHAYAASFMNSSIAAQIKIIREQREWTQAELAERIGTKQAGISRLENVNYDAWKVETLTRIAKAFDVRLRISFEEFDSLDDEVRRFGRSSLERASYDESRVGESNREGLSNTLEVTEALRKALSPHPWIADTLNRNISEGREHAPEIGAASQSLRLFGAGGFDPWKKPVSLQVSGLAGREVPLPEDSPLAS
jgi:transcriptional regulator with XRE-family HTH domain